MPSQGSQETGAQVDNVNTVSSASCTLARGPIIPTPTGETEGTLSQAVLRLIMKDPSSSEKFSVLSSSSEGIWPQFPT